VVIDPIRHTDGRRSGFTCRPFPGSDPPGFRAAAT